MEASPHFHRPSILRMVAWSEALRSGRSLFRPDFCGHWFMDHRGLYIHTFSDSFEFYRYLSSSFDMLPYPPVHPPVQPTSALCTSTYAFGAPSQFVSESFTKFHIILPTILHQLWIRLLRLFLSGWPSGVEALVKIPYVQISYGVLDCSTL